MKEAMNMYRNRIPVSRTACGILMLAGVFFMAAPARAQSDLNINLYEAVPSSTSNAAVSSNGVVTSPALKQTADPSLGFRIGLRHMFHPHFGLEANWGYNRATQHFSGVPSDTAPVYSHAKPITIDYVATVKTYRGFKIFVLAGAGVVSYNISSYGTGTGSSVTLPAQSELMPAGEYGVGADYSPHKFPSHLGLRFQYRGIIEHPPDFKLKYLATSSLINISEPSVGLVFKF